MAYKKTLTKEERQQKQDEYEREVADLFIKAIKENAGSNATWTSGRIVTRNIAKWT